MPPFRFSFLGRFALCCCAFAAVSFCLYYIMQVLYAAPAPLAAAYDIAPQWTAAQAKKTGRQLAAAKPPAAEALQADNLQRGRRVFARCAACHSAAKGGGNRLGPNLWGINGRPVASAAGFSYSAAMQAFANKQKNWDLAALDRFLTAPAKIVPGTLMFYPGVKDMQERADLLLYLQSLKD